MSAGPYVLGVDPGVAHTGWAVLDMCGPRPLWIAGGTTNIERIRAGYDVDASTATVDLAVVETPVALHRPEANAQLIGTAVMAGRIIEACELRAESVIEISPAQWRMSLIGRSKAGERQDAAVKRVLTSMIEGLPSRTSAHVRDAAGAAIVGWRMWMRK